MIKFIINEINKLDKNQIPELVKQMFLFTSEEPTNIDTFVEELSTVYNELNVLGINRYV